MSAPRLATSVLAGALMRKAQGEGGFAAVLAKGDPTSGSLLLILTEKGADPCIYERVLQGDGAYRWTASGTEASQDPAQVPEFVARRRRFDPDLWVIELDIPSRQRFADEMTAFD
ncbi:MAG TPA: DUF1491 family protein [Allosphingosinicella sp.]|jgi:hypothetical protein